MFRLLSKIYFKLIGWKIRGEVPKDIKKCVMIAAPHTSNYDYPITMATFQMMGLRVRFLAKKQLFAFPLGLLMKGSGGIPVDRSKSNNLVEYMVSLFNEYDQLVLLIPPEGTRSKVKEWKTGFYRVAQLANVPIILGYLDYKEKVAGFGPVFYPTGSLEEDMEAIKAFYKDITPKYPNMYQSE